MGKGNAFWGEIPRPSDGPWWHRHGLTLFLGGVLLIQTLVAAILMWFVWRNSWDVFQEGKVPGMWVFVVFFMGQFLLSVLADTYGAWLQVWATKHFVEKDSPQSKDSDS